MFDTNLETLATCSCAGEQLVPVEAGDQSMGSESSDDVPSTPTSPVGNIQFGFTGFRILLVEDNKYGMHVS